MHDDQHQHQHDTAFDSADALAEMLDLDAEVLHAYLSDAISWVRHLGGDLPTRRIVDLGSGTGTGTVALARAFPDAEVIAVDSSPQLLTRVRAKARDLGAADRIVTVEADLDGPWPITQVVDVVWASMSVHHLADPDRVLADILASMRSGGRLVVAEPDGLLRFLPDDLGIGRPGLEARCHRTLAEAHARHMPPLGSDWGPRLAHAGFAGVTTRTFAIAIEPPLPALAARYAQTFLQHVRSQLDGTIGAEDQATLDALIDSKGPHSVLHRHDLAVRGTRTLWAGTKP
jgi:SAM-dependent methyltransferase